MNVYELDGGIGKKDDGAECDELVVHDGTGLRKRHVGKNVLEIPERTQPDAIRDEQRAHCRKAYARVVHPLSRQKHDDESQFLGSVKRDEEDCGRKFAGRRHQQGDKRKHHQEHFDDATADRLREEKEHKSRQKRTGGRKNLYLDGAEHGDFPGPPRVVEKVEEHSAAQQGEAPRNENADSLESAQNRLLLRS